MPRRKRRFVPGIVYHLISRFVDREWFIANQSEREQYLHLLGSAITLSDWRCLAYAVMSNHIHLAMIAGTQRLDTWIRRAHSPFAGWMNRKHDRVGNIFVRGPKDLLIPDDGVGRVIAYIHGNPVRARIVDRPEASSWTSHRAYIGLDRAPRWLDVEAGLARSAIADVRTFDSFVKSGPDHPLATNGQDLDAVLEEYERAQLEAVKPDSGPAVDPLIVAHISADEVGVPLQHLWSTRRGGLESVARAVVVRCCLRLGASTVEIAHALRMTPQAVSAIRARDSDDLTLAHCERVLRRISITTLANRASYPQIL